MKKLGMKMYIGAGMWAVQTQDDKFELQDKNGEPIVQGNWDIIHKASDGVALAISNGKAHYIRSNGQVFHICDWMHAGCFSEGWAVGGDRTGKNGDRNRDAQLYYFDLKGETRLRLDSQWREARGFREGLAAVAMGSNPYRLSWGFIDKTGRAKIEPKWNRVFDFSGGLAVVVQNNRFAVIDQLGRELASGLKRYPSDAVLSKLREGVKANER